MHLEDILQGICKFTAAGFAKIFIAQYAASGGNVAKLIFMDLVLVNTRTSLFIKNFSFHKIEEDKQLAKTKTARKSIGSNYSKKRITKMKIARNVLLPNNAQPHKYHATLSFNKGQLTKRKPTAKRSEYAIITTWAAI